MFGNNIHVFFLGDVERQRADEFHLLSEFGEGWPQPNGLIVRPHFIADQYSTSLTVQRDLEVKLKIGFFEEVSKILESEKSLSGYLVFDIDLKDLRPGDSMKTHAMLFSSHVFRIIELIDNEESIEKAERQLRHVVRSVSLYIDKKVLVEGVIVFPCKVRLPASMINSATSILYRDELEQLFQPFSQACGESSKVTADGKIVLSKMLQISFFEQCHPKTKQEATCLAAHRLFLQRPNEKIKQFSQIDFNLIKLNDTQNSIKNDLLAGNTLVWGGYGTGKSVAIVAAIKESIEHYKKLVKDNKCEQKGFKILFLSAQGLLNEVDVMLSPFLLLTEKWIKEICEDIGCYDTLQILSYPQFGDRNIHFLIQATSSSKGDIVFCSYLLKMSDFEILKTNPTFVNNFDVIVLEETHAVDSNTITNFVSCFEENKTVKGRNSRVWITSNAEKLDLKLPGFRVSPKSGVKQHNLRNTPAVARLAEAVDVNIGPERYPSTTVPMPLSKCHIGLTYEFEFDSEKRLRKVVEEVKRWKELLPTPSVLLIDCEESDLYQKLKGEGICFKMCKDKHEINESLLLLPSDPVEAIVAGAEWHVMIIHITGNTLNSIKMIRLFNKRIISRATTKIIIFSDRVLDMNEVKTGYLKSVERAEANVETEGSSNIVNCEGAEIEHQDEYYNLHRLNDAISNPSMISNTVINGLSVRQTNSVENIISGNLIEKFESLHSKMIASGEKFTHCEGYDLTQIRYLDDSLRKQNDDVYLICGKDTAFIVQLDSDSISNWEVIKAQNFLESIWKVQLPAYCGQILVSPRETKNVTRISKLLYLLQPKILISKDINSGAVFVSAEETDQFTKNGKFSWFLVVRIPFEL